MSYFITIVQTLFLSHFKFHFVIRSLVMHSLTIRKRRSRIRYNILRCLNWLHISLNLNSLRDFCRQTKNWMRSRIHYDLELYTKSYSNFRSALAILEINCWWQLKKWWKVNLLSLKLCNVWIENVNCKLRTSNVSVGRYNALFPEIFVESRTRSWTKCTLLKILIECPKTLILNNTVSALH